MTTAYWCVLVSVFLPFLFAAIAKFSGPGFDNASPRAFLANLDGFRQRANWAQMNQFESNPPFAAGVIIAHVLGGPQATIDLIAVSWIALRVLYGAAYMANLASVRSLLWTASLACVVSLFLIVI